MKVQVDIVSKTIALEKTLKYSTVVNKLHKLMVDLQFHCLR